ncbi:hypothetical protein [Pseudomonas cremoricolorata]|uniref:Uncharacterized protein n=1 Tax=Pseudomonas cremoricolorata TaxID=157783 RepID=A0A089WMG3_9PSED|nr:hypothetical protein [Pseudomonas cremoricolorata]AIR90500.1 hypothetical protein LK03_14925 [Pseudomonas cremoricolorata]
MTDVVNLNKTSATAALQVVVELIRAGHLKAGIPGREAEMIIATHKQLSAYFETSKGEPLSSTDLS